MKTALNALNAANLWYVLSSQYFVKCFMDILNKGVTNRLVYGCIVVVIEF